MATKTWTIIGSTLTIPNVVGEFHAGQYVVVDEDTNEVLETGLLGYTPPSAPPSKEVAVASKDVAISNKMKEVL